MGLCADHLFVVRAETAVELRELLDSEGVLVELRDITDVGWFDAYTGKYARWDGVDFVQFSRGWLALLWSQEKLTGAADDHIYCDGVDAENEAVYEAAIELLQSGSYSEPMA